MPGEQTLAQVIRAQYPGAYDHVTDLALEAAIARKYPGQYANVPRTKSRAAQSRQSVLPKGSIEPMPAAEPVQDLTGGTFDYENAANDRIALPVLATTGAMMAGGGLLGLAGRSAIPYIAPLARGTATALANPAVGGAVGAATGAYNDGIRGALVGGATGAAFGPQSGRLVRRLANKLSPTATRVSANTAASRRMVQGMSQAPAATPASAAPAAPPASTPATPAPAAAATAGKSAPARRTGQTAPRQTRQQQAITRAADQAGVTLTPEETTAVQQLVREGATPADAVEALRRLKAPATPTPVPAPKTPRARKARTPPVLDPYETEEYVRIVKTGKTHEEAMALIEAQRKLIQRTGAMRPAEARADLAYREETGRWKPRP